LYDSNVVRRIPDRLIPVGDSEYDVASKLPRSGGNFMLGQFDLDNNGDLSDPFGIDTTGAWNNNPTSVTYMQRKAFEQAVAYSIAHPSTPWAGFWPYHGQTVAHDRIDYVRVWDLPAGTTIPNFPN
jgi:hypothetical protein